MFLLSLFRRDSDYVGSHAVEPRAPSDATCDECGKDEPQVSLAQCLICETWWCAACFTMHKAPEGWDDPTPSRWKRLLRKVVRR